MGVNWRRRGGVVALSLLASCKGARPPVAAPAPESAVVAATHDAAVAAELPEGGLRFGWKAGKRYAYSLSWAVAARYPIAMKKQISTSFAFDADVVFGATDESRGARTVVVGVERVGRYLVRVGEKEVLGDNAAGKEARDALLRHEAAVRVTARGVVEAISFRKGTPVEVREALRRLVLAISVTLPEKAAKEWEVSETTPTGTARARYVVASDKPRVLSRTRGDYTAVTAVPLDEKGLADARQDVNGRGTIVLDAQGEGLVSLDETEDLRITSNSDPSLPSTVRTALSLKLTRVESLDLARVKVDEFSEVHRGFIVEVDRKAIDQQYAAEMTGTKLRATLMAYAVRGRLPEGFMVDAAAYLRLHPEIDRELVAYFGDAKTSHNGRALTVDLLSAAGDRAAQRAFREVLSLPVARADKERFGDYLARFMFLARPERESVDFLSAVYDRAKKEGDITVQGAAVVALGAVARTLRELGETDLARALHARIRGDLEGRRRLETDGKVQNVELLVYLLKGLGNAAVADDAALVSRFAGDPNVNVRDQAAFSLRHLDTPKARETLLALAQDGSHVVAATAIRALGTQSMTRDDWRRFRALVVDKKTNSLVDPAVVELVSAQRANASDDGDEILRAVLARTTGGDPHLRNEIITLLGNAR